MTFLVLGPYTPLFRWVGLQEDQTKEDKDKPAPESSGSSPEITNVFIPYKAQIGLRNELKRPLKTGTNFSPVSFFPYFHKLIIYFTFTYCIFLHTQVRRTSHHRAM